MLYCCIFAKEIKLFHAELYKKQFSLFEEDTNCINEHKRIINSKVRELQYIHNSYICATILEDKLQNRGVTNVLWKYKKE